jgi:uncharacterized MAPEG superfamily protein
MRVKVLIAIAIVTLAAAAAQAQGGRGNQMTPKGNQPTAEQIAKARADKAEREKAYKDALKKSRNRKINRTPGRRCADTGAL